MGRRRAHPRRGPGDRDRRGADGRLDGPGRARRHARAPGAATTGPARARRCGGRARRPATSSTWTASTPTATATPCWCRCTRRAWPAIPARARASSRAWRRRGAGGGRRRRRAPGFSRWSSACSNSRGRAAGGLVRGAPPRQGRGQICRKIGEEATEVVTAALGGEGDERVVSEVADLWFHSMVLLDEPRHPPAARLRRAGSAATPRGLGRPPEASTVSAGARSTGAIVALALAGRRSLGLLAAAPAAPTGSRAASSTRQGLPVTPARTAGGRSTPGAEADLELRRDAPAGGMLADATCEGACARPAAAPCSPASSSSALTHR